MSKSVLTFDEAAHRYYMDGQPVPGVTSIIGAVIPRRFSPGDYYLQRGSALHRAIHLLTLGKLDMASVDESYKGKLDAFQKFRSEVGGEFVASEIRLASSRYLYAGTIDTVLKIRCQSLLVDWKSSFEPTVELQLGAYWRLLTEKFNVEARQNVFHQDLLPDFASAVELKDDGTYKMHSFTKRQMELASQQFLSALSVFNFMQKHNLLPKETLCPSK